MIYASATKGTFALHAATITAASKSKLFDDYVKELEFSKPEILKAMKNMTPKIPLDASRWEGEMYEIAKTFETLNLTPKLHEGAADIMKLAQKTPISKENRQTYNEYRDSVLSILSWFKRRTNDCRRYCRSSIRRLRKR